LLLAIDSRDKLVELITVEVAIIDRLNASTIRDNVPVVPVLEA